MKHVVQMARKMVALGACVVSAVSCSVRDTEPPLDFAPLCEVWCARYLECLTDIAPTEKYDSQAGCVDHCVENPMLQHCTKEHYATFECEVAPENACPTFRRIWTDPDGPCQMEIEVSSACIESEVNK